MHLLSSLFVLLLLDRLMIYSHVFPFHVGFLYWSIGCFIFVSTAAPLLSFSAVTPLIAFLISPYTHISLPHLAYVTDTAESGFIACFFNASIPLA